MVKYQLNWQPTSTPPQKRITRTKFRLRIDIPVESFQTAFLSFDKAAETFEMSLSDPQHRKFAHQYLGFLQDIAHGSAQLRPPTKGRPDYRLIGAELERLFRCHFFRPDDLDSIQN
jgi:hypothetical protein